MPLGILRDIVAIGCGWFSAAIPMKRLALCPDFEKYLPQGKHFDYLMRVSGEVKRRVRDRETVGFQLGDNFFFIKRYYGCGWREILKESLQGRRPVLGANREWCALRRLAVLGIAAPHPVGFGMRGHLPSRYQSFIVTEALVGMISLEDLVLDWGGLGGKRQAHLRRCLLKRLADISRTLHDHGINHRDYYLCHFLVLDRNWINWRPKSPLDVILIDLHRAQMRQRVPRRWRVKDLSSLLFSSLDAGLTSRDLLVFALRYRQGRGKLLRKERTFWQQVFKRAIKLYRQIHGKWPQLPDGFANFS